MTIATTFARIHPWVSRLRADAVKVTARDGTPDDPILGEVECRPGDREQCAEELATLVDAACEASERSVAVTLVAWDGDDLAISRMVCRVKPPKSGEIVSAEPSADLVKTLTLHTQVLIKVMVDAQNGILTSYSNTIDMLSERLAKVETARAMAEQTAREAMDLTDIAVSKARASKDSTQGRLVAMLEAAAPTIAEKFLGSGTGKEVAKVIAATKGEGEASGEAPAAADGA